MTCRANDNLAYAADQRHNVYSGGGVGRCMHPAPLPLLVLKSSQSKSCTGLGSIFRTAGQTQQMESNRAQQAADTAAAEQMYQVQPVLGEHMMSTETCRVPENRADQQYVLALPG